MSAEDEGGDVLHADFQFFGDKRPEAGGIEHAGHADHALAGKSAELVGGLRHGVERVGDDDQDAVRRMLHDLADHVRHDFVVGVEQVVAAHAGLARNSGGDDDDVGVGGVGVVVGADDVGVALLDGHGFEQVEALALRHAFDDVDENDVGEFLRGDPVGGGCAHVSGTYDAYFLAHDFLSGQIKIKGKGFYHRGH